MSRPLTSLLGKQLPDLNYNTLSAIWKVQELFAYSQIAKNTTQTKLTNFPIDTDTTKFIVYTTTVGVIS